jgi:ATP-binding protein involved in chromosome partitioning
MTDTLLTQAAIETALSSYQDPYLNTDLVSFGAVQNISISPAKTGSDITVDIHLPYPSDFVKGGTEEILKVMVGNVEGVENVAINTKHSRSD